MSVSSTSAPAVSTSAPVVSVKNVVHRYGHVVALDNLSLDVPSGIMAGMVGSDGVGKSTLMGLIAGAKEIQEGTVMVLDGDMASAPPNASGNAKCA